MSVNWHYFKNISRTVKPGKHDIIPKAGSIAGQPSDLYALTGY
jgi:hypothetical protein